MRAAARTGGKTGKAACAKNRRASRLPIRAAIKTGTDDKSLGCAEKDATCVTSGFFSWLPGQVAPFFGATAEYSHGINPKAFKLTRTPSASLLGTDLALPVFPGPNARDESWVGEPRRSA
jgi:hypothetical protein